MTDETYSPEGEDQSDSPVAILRTFVAGGSVKRLSGLAILSYLAGREGDDEWAWAMEAGDALIDAFFAKPLPPNTLHPRSGRWRAAQAILERAFAGGRAQREIDLAVVGEPGTALAEYAARQVATAAVCDRAMAVARAHATIYVSEIEFPDDRHPENIRREIGYVATKVAQRHAVTDGEAAYCALRAFEERGLDTTLEAAEWALDCAKSGRADREAEEQRAHERAAEIEAATGALFGGQE